jgi:RNA polymerase sigma-70 factor (ECF subfamily)
MMAQDGTDRDAGLVAQAQAGDRTAFDRLVVRYRGLLRAMAFLRTSDQEAAEDLVQTVLATAWAKLPTLEHPAAFKGWLTRIMANACTDWHRRRGQWPASLEEIDDELPTPPALAPPAVLLAREKSRRLRAALLSLSPENRLALLLHLWDGCPYAEIARLLDIPLTTVEGRIYRAKTQLRRLLTDDTELIGEPRKRWQAKEDRR